MSLKRDTLSFVSKTYKIHHCKRDRVHDSKCPVCDAKKQQLLVFCTAIGLKPEQFFRITSLIVASRPLAAEEVILSRGLALASVERPRSTTAYGGASETVQLFVQLLKLSSLISGPMQDGVAEPNQVAHNEIKIMMCLGGEGALAGHDITEIMAIPPMNVSRALSSLSERGWIEAITDATNRRRKPFQLSEVGWAAHAAMTPDIAAVADYVLGTLSDRERKSLSKAAFKVIDRMADWFEEHHAGTHLKHPG
jgi:DNA-binding MarR family transcriptional regulator